MRPDLALLDLVASFRLMTNMAPTARHPHFTARRQIIRKAAASVPASVVPLSTPLAAQIAAVVQPSSTLPRIPSLAAQSARSVLLAVAQPLSSARCRARFQRLRARFRRLNHHEETLCLHYQAPCIWINPVP